MSLCLTGCFASAYGVQAATRECDSVKIIAVLMGLLA